MTGIKSHYRLAPISQHPSVLAADAKDKEVATRHEAAEREVERLTHRLSHGEVPAGTRLAELIESLTRTTDEERVRSGEEVRQARRQAAAEIGRAAAPEYQQCLLAAKAALETASAAIHAAHSHWTSVAKAAAPESPPLPVCGLMVDLHSRIGQVVKSLTTLLDSHRRLWQSQP